MINVSVTWLENNSIAKDIGHILKPEHAHYLVYKIPSLKLSRSRGAKLTTHFHLVMLR
jgi:hypothetical protein